MVEVAASCVVVGGVADAAVHLGRILLLLLLLLRKHALGEGGA